VVLIFVGQPDDAGQAGGFYCEHSTSVNEKWRLNRALRGTR
jgi:hypothetical protein